jgi:hypothetical protein
MTLSAVLSQRPLIIKAAFVGAFFSALTVTKTYPLIRHFGTHLPDNLGDPLLVTWILAWGSHALTTDPWNLFNANIFYPVQNTLALSEHMIAVVPIFAPAYITTGNPIFAYNMVFLMSFIFCGISMFLLVHHWTKDFWASLLSGCLFAFAPIRFAQINHMQLYNFYWAPLAFLFLDKFVYSKRWTDLTWFAVFYWLQVLCSVYLGWFTTIAAAAYILYCTVYVDRSLLSRTMVSRYALFIISSLLILLPFHMPYYIIQRQWQLLSLLQQCVIWSADPLLHYLSPPHLFNDVYLSFLRSHFPLLAWHRGEMHLFPGFVFGVLVAMGYLPVITSLQSCKALQLKKLFGIVLITSLVLSLGPFLVILGKNTGIPLPYLPFYYLVPGFQTLRVPARFAFMAVLAAAVIAALGFLKASDLLWTRCGVKQASRSVFHGLLALFWIGLFILELGFKPLPLAGMPTSDRVPEVYHWLATGPLKGAIIELPLGQMEWAALTYMYFSTYHWLPLVNGASRFYPPTYTLLSAEIAALPSRESAELLSAIGVKALIVHTDQLERSEAARWQQANLAELGLEEMARFGSDVVYQLSPVDAMSQLHLELAVPDELPTGEITPLLSGAMMRLGFRAENGSHRRWVHPSLQGRTQAQIKWEGVATGKSLIQQDILELPIMISAEDFWSIGLPVRTPSSPGRYKLTLAFPALGLETAPKLVQVVPGSYLTSANDSQLLSAAYILERPSSPEITSHGIDVTMQVMNTGQGLWLAEAKDERGKVRLGWRWYRGNDALPFKEGRENLPYDIFPGQVYKFQTAIEAPLEAGEYTLEIGLVCERLTWFSDRGVSPFKFMVHVGESARLFSP